MGAGLAMISGSLSTMAFAFANDIVLEVYYFLGIILTIGIIIFIGGLKRWYNGEEKKQQLYEEIITDILKTNDEVTPTPKGEGDSK